MKIFGLGSFTADRFITVLDNPPPLLLTQRQKITTVIITPLIILFSSLRVFVWILRIFTIYVNLVKEKKKSLLKTMIENA